VSYLAISFQFTFFFSNCQSKVSCLAIMAASTSRQPHDIPLPCSPYPHPKTRKSTTSRKGKGKENCPQSPHTRSLANQPSDTPWEWTSLADPAASKSPPIFTKDGR